MPLALVLLLAAAVPLDDDPTFREGLAAFQTLHLEDAALRFQRVALDDTRPPHERARVQMWLGATYGQLGDLPRARDAFAFAFALSPDAQLPVRVSPKVMAVLEEERTKARDQREAAIAAKARADAEAEAARRAAPPSDPLPPTTTPPADAPPSAPVAASPAVTVDDGPELAAAPALPVTTATRGPGMLNAVTVTGGLVVGVGVLLAVATVMNAGLSTTYWLGASNPETKQQDAIDDKALADLLAVGAWAGGAAAVVTTGVGVAIIWAGLPGE